MIDLMVVEDNEKLRRALVEGFQAAGRVRVGFACAAGEEALNYCLDSGNAGLPQVVLMDVQLAGALNGIRTATAIRREFPRFPVVFYSIQDDDQYYRDFRKSGILSHYAYVRKSNYLLPQMLVPLLELAISGQGFIDEEIEDRVQQVRHKDEQTPMGLLEPNEAQVARMLAQGLTNEQIAARMGFRDKRSISRINGQIYSCWGLNDSSTDEKTARTRAALIVHNGQLIQWDAEGMAWIIDENNRRQPFHWGDG